MFESIWVDIGYELTFESLLYSILIIQMSNVTYIRMKNDPPVEGDTAEDVHTEHAWGIQG